MKFSHIVFTFLMILAPSILANGTSSISGHVWLDANADGLEQTNEGRVADIRVRLYLDHNEDGLAERVMGYRTTDANGAYSFTALAGGRYQVGVDMLSLPEDLYRLTERDVGGDESIDNDVDPHTLRTSNLDVGDNQALANAGDIGVLQGLSGLRYIGAQTVKGQPAHVWHYQDGALKLQDTGYDPNDPEIRAIVTQWLKWYRTGETILQEAEILSNYLNLARQGNDKVKDFITINGQGSYATSRAFTSSGIPAQTLLDNPYSMVDHILMFYESTRGSNPIWKYRANWPFGARLTHHSITAMTLLELGGPSTFTVQPSVTAWNPGRDSLELLRQWELMNTTFEEAFPYTAEYLPDLGEQVNHYSIDLPHPEGGGIINVESRGILTGILMKTLQEMGRDKAIEILHNMSKKQWFIPSMEEGLIAFRQAVDDATDGAYADHWVSKWGFPPETTYADNRATDSGAPSSGPFFWDCKPHNFDASQIRPGYRHLSDQTINGFGRWAESRPSGFLNLGGINNLAETITYPNKDACVVAGEGVEFVQTIPNGSWLIQAETMNGAQLQASFPNDELVYNFGYGYAVKVSDGELTIRFSGRVELSELTIIEGAAPNAGIGIINAAGLDGPGFVRDIFYDGGKLWKISEPVEGEGALADLYRTHRWGTFTYDLRGLAPNTEQTVKLYLSENYWDQPGKRRFDVRANGTTVLSDYDLYVEAGGKRKAKQEVFTVETDAEGRIVLEFISRVNVAQVNGIEVVDPIFPTPQPEAFALQSPADAAVNVPTSPTLDWTDSEGATTYWVSVNAVGGAAAFTGVVVTSTWTLPHVLQNETTYEWTVMARNEGGETPVASWTFTTEAIICHETTGPFDDQTAYFWDFGPDQAPLQPSWRRFTDCTTAGFLRWVSTPASFGGAIHADGDLAGDVMAQSQIYGEGPADLVHDLSEGRWSVTIFFSDDANQSGMRVFAEGQQVLSDIQLAANTQVSKTFQVDVADGSLNLAFDDADPGKRFTVSGMALTRMGPIPEMTKNLRIIEGGILQWTSLPGLNYTVEKCTDLNGGSWEFLSNLTATAGTSEVVDPASALTRCYYRVVRHVNP